MTKYAIMDIFRKFVCSFFKPFVKIELSFAYAINLFTSTENCMEMRIILQKQVFFSHPSNNSRQLINFNINAVVLRVIIC